MPAPSFPSFTRLFLLVCAGCSIAFSPALSASSPRLSADTLHSLLEQALAVFSKNDFQTAADLFQQIEDHFGDEPEYRDPAFLRRLLPVRGHSELAAGLPTAAVRSLSVFVDAYSGDSQHPRALLALATALQQDGRPNEAIQRLNEFIQTYPRRPEAPLVRLQKAEALFQTGKTAAAFDLIADMLREDPPGLLGDQARLRAVRQMITLGEIPAAAALLLDHPWDFTTTPEIPLLGFTALELADLLMEAEEYDQAVRAYRLVPDRARLLHLQEDRIESARTFLLRRPQGEAERFWNDYHRRLVAGMRSQLTALHESEDHTPALLLRRGQAMLLVDRHHEAWLLFERLALDESLQTSLREEAHYRWILAANGLELWEEALAIARNFLARYPEAPLAPQTLYLIAQAHQEQRRYPEAAVILTDLLADFPDHPLGQRWRFTLGFNRTLLEDFPAARMHFSQAAEDYPESQLTTNSQLWHGLTFFFERNYDTALSEFERLVLRYPTHPLSGEILYRRAATLYAMRNYERAEKETSDFVERFQYHPRHGEALVLLGDIRMGAGDLDLAMAAFRQIQPEAGSLFLYGLFQQGKIHRAEQNFEGMIALFSDYVERSDLEEKPRLSEALYWIGWAYTELEKTESAVPFFLASLNGHGNDPAATEIGSILELLERLYPLPNEAGEDFSVWLEAQRRQALSDGKLTYFSRLNLYLARLKRRQNSPHQADNLLFEIVDLIPAEKLGPDALGEVGQMLAESQLQNARSFFLTLLKEYPNAPERALAYHGLGQHHHDRGNHKEALIWLRRFENETPTHSLAARSLQLAGQSLIALERFDVANERFEEILRLRSMRGRPHAKALTGLGESALGAGDPQKAAAYYQRVYTMHRAQPDLASQAYYQSSRILEELNDPAGAHRTLEEMLSLPELSVSPFYEQAREREAILAARVAALNLTETE